MPTRAALARCIDTERIEAAIANAERRTSGEIRVSIAPFFTGDVQRTAERAFARLGMKATRERNGVLLLIVPARRKFAFVGDVGIHRRVGQEFWDELTALLSDHFRADRYTEGVLAVIERIGERMAADFPATAGPRADELPNTVDVAPA